jgi:hypothetical protein
MCKRETLMLLHIPIDTTLARQAKVQKGVTTWEVYVTRLIARDLETAAPNVKLEPLEQGTPTLPVGRTT